MRSIPRMAGGIVFWIKYRFAPKTLVIGGQIISLDSSVRSSWISNRYHKASLTANQVVRSANFAVAGASDIVPSGEISRFFDPLRQVCVIGPLFAVGKWQQFTVKENVMASDQPLILKLTFSVKKTRNRNGVQYELIGSCRPDYEQTAKSRFVHTMLRSELPTGMQN